MSCAASQTGRTAMAPAPPLAACNSRDLAGFGWPSETGVSAAPGDQGAMRPRPGRDDRVRNVEKLAGMIVSPTAGRRMPNPRHQIRKSTCNTLRPPRDDALSHKAATHCTIEYISYGGRHRLRKLLVTIHENWPAGAVNSAAARDPSYTSGPGQATDSCHERVRFAVRVGIRESADVLTQALTASISTG